MKKPRLLNLAAGVSLLLAIVALWVRSYAHREEFAHFWHTSTEQCSWHVQSSYSSLVFLAMHSPYQGTPYDPSSPYYDYTPQDSKHSRRRQWFAFPPIRFQNHSTPADRDDIRELSHAYWLLLLPTLPLPLIALVRHRRQRHRETNNLCPTCGYGLRATPEKGGDLFVRCPECGAERDMQKSQG